MAQSQPVQFQLPVKGIVKGLAYSDHPPEAAIDALNVLPFDTGGRMRLSPRPGTAKLWAAALGVNPIQVLMQTTTALDPSTIIADQLIATDAFTYANGFLATVGSPNWRTSQTASVPSSGVALATTNVISVSSNTCLSSLADNYVAAIYLPALVLGTAYIVQANVISAYTGTTQNSFGVGLICRQDKTSYGTTTNTVWCNLNKNGVYIFQNATLKASFAFATPLSTSTAYALEMHVNGDVFQLYVNSVLYLTTTITGGSSNSGVGFRLIDGTGVGYPSSRVDDFKVYTGRVGSLRQTNLVAAAGGNVYVGDISTQGTIASGGTGALANSGPVSAAAIFGKVYLTCGLTTLKVLDIVSKTVTDFVPSAGTETATSLGQYQLAAIYRGRLVLAADRLNPQNFVLSRVGSPTDFNYATTDVATAFAGNASKAGQIGEPIVSLMPFSDDIMLIGGDHNLWAVRGDPADGGSIDLVSDAIGVLGKDAWTKSPDGTVYFAGTGGLFRMSPQGSTPECISDAKVNEIFRAINRGSQYVLLAWDRDRHQLMIFIVPINTGSATSVVWDQRTEGFWFIQYPDSHGPLCALVYDGDGPTDRATLLGGRTGYIQQVTSALNDDGTAISSYVYLGPQRVDDSTDAVIDSLEAVMGKSPTTDADWNCTLSIVAGQTVEQAFTAPLHTRTRTQTAGGRQSWWYPKVRGNAFFLKVANSTLNKTWVFERAAGQMTASSPVRRKV